MLSFQEKMSSLFEKNMHAYKNYRLSSVIFLQDIFYTMAFLLRNHSREGFKHSYWAEHLQVGEWHLEEEGVMFEWKELYLGQYCLMYLESIEE